MHDERYDEWIDLAADGELGEIERVELAAHAATCGVCEREGERSLEVVRRLAASQVAVRPGFAREVMAALEPAPWEARAPRAWRLPAAVLLAIGGASAALVGLGAAELSPAGDSAGALYTMVDLFRAAFVAGSGVAAASWRGVGASVGNWLGASPANWAAASVLTGGVHYLLYRLLRRRTDRTPVESPRSR